MKIKFRKGKAAKLPDYVSSDAVAQFVGCSKRTVNRWLKDQPNLGITVKSASGKSMRVLSRDEAKKLSEQMKVLHKYEKEAATDG